MCPGVHSSVGAWAPSSGVTLSSSLIWRVTGAPLALGGLPGRLPGHTFLVGDLIPVFVVFFTLDMAAHPLLSCLPTTQVLTGRPTGSDSSIVKVPGSLYSPWFSPASLPWSAWMIPPLRYRGPLPVFP